MEYQVKAGLIGKRRVIYACPKCDAELDSGLEEAGNPDKCPTCGTGFTVPGSAELQREQEAIAVEKQKKAERLKAHEEQRAQALEAKRVAAEAANRRAKEAELARREAEADAAKRADQQKRLADEAAARAPARAPAAGPVPQYKALHLLAQLITAAGYVIIIVSISIGILGVALTLYRGEDGEIAAIGLMVGTTLSSALGGLVIAGIGQAMLAFRDIAINSWHARAVHTA